MAEKNLRKIGTITAEIAEAGAQSAQRRHHQATAARFDDAEPVPTNATRRDFFVVGALLAARDDSEL